MAVDLSIPVLVVHDYPTMGSIVTNVLRQIGFAHIEGANGPKALRKLRDKAYGLVISDDAMAPMSGEELLRAIRAKPKTARMPFLLLSSQDNAARAASREHIVAKPFNARTLQDKIAAVLQN